MIVPRAQLTPINRSGKGTLRPKLHLSGLALGGARRSLRAGGPSRPDGNRVRNTQVLQPVQLNQEGVLGEGKTREDVDGKSLKIVISPHIVVVCRRWSQLEFSKDWTI